MFYVYVLRSNKTGRRYVGSCEDLDDRFRRHNVGESKATKHGIPWTIASRRKVCDPRCGHDKGTILQNRTRP
ncbi:MAG: hypothetical protein DLM73_04385 [Chthoniobacterales bacterium]|nr:MAG: hypothetical protein DLM73_04385 [Chthoniobacterales bacterium]